MATFVVFVQKTGGDVALRPGDVIDVRAAAGGGTEIVTINAHAPKAHVAESVADVLDALDAVEAGESQPAPVDPVAQFTSEVRDGPLLLRVSEITSIAKGKLDSHVRVKLGGGESHSIKETEEEARAVLERARASAGTRRAPRRPSAASPAPVAAATARPRPRVKVQPPKRPSFAAMLQEQGCEVIVDKHGTWGMPPAGKSADVIAALAKHGFIARLMAGMLYETATSPTK